MQRTTKTKRKFEINQHIVYPIQGVGIISQIETISFNNTPMPYYIIFLPDAEMTIKVPVDRAEELGIRLIASKKEAKEAMKIFDTTSFPTASDWKQRYQQHLDLLRKGDIESIALVVCSLYTRKTAKELPILEQKLYSNAVKILGSELSLALEMDKQEIESMIFERIQQSIQRSSQEAMEANTNTDQEKEKTFDTEIPTDLENLAQ